MPTRTTLILLLVFAGMISGCSSGAKEVPTASLTGEVKRMNGKPIGDVTVVFYPETGPSAVANTDAAGKFTATVPVGECKVAVVANGSASSEDTSPEALAALEKERAKSEVDGRFASPDTSGLTVTVKPEQDEKVVFVVE